MSIADSRTSMQNNNIPRLWLISAANAAVSPTASVMGKFYEVTVRMSKKGDLTEDEAANLRYSTYARAEIMSVCGGNPDMLDDTSVLEGTLYIKELARVTPQIQVLEDLLKDSSSAT